MAVFKAFILCVATMAMLAPRQSSAQTSVPPPPTPQTTHPQLGYYQNPGGGNCVRGDEIFKLVECQAAAQQLTHNFAKQVNDPKGRPHGCFWDQSGGVYFNVAQGGYSGGWGGVGGMCRRRGAFLVESGALVSKPGDKYSQGAPFTNQIWITQASAQARSDLFYPSGGGCPQNLGIWLHKEYDGSEDLAGPFVVTKCNPNDAGLYSMTFGINAVFPGRTKGHQLTFVVKDVIYVRNKDGKPSVPVTPAPPAPRTTTQQPATTPDPLIADLKKQLDALAAQLKVSSAQSFDAVNQEILTLSNGLQKVVDTGTAMGDLVAKNARNVDTKITGVDDRARTLEQRVATLETGTKQDRDAQDVVNNGAGVAMMGVAKRLDALEAAKTAAETKAAELATQNTQLKEQLAALTKAVVQQPGSGNGCSTSAACLPEVATTGNKDLGLSISAKSGKIVFETETCGETDLCDLARDVAAIKSKFNQ